MNKILLTEKNWEIVVLKIEPFSLLFITSFFFKAHVGPEKFTNIDFDRHPDIEVLHVAENFAKKLFLSKNVNVENVIEQIYLVGFPDMEEGWKSR